jgi:hypothetical protein
MKVEKTQNSLQVQLSGDFNLNAVRLISELLSDRNEISIDLTNSRFVNSKSILFLNDLIQNQKIVRLKNPPKTFFEVLHILGLHQTWDLKSIIEP